jgi:hypothetical protein
MNLQYIAGFFDGEGHVRIQKYRNKGRQYSKVVATITQTDRAVLDRIVEHFGCGGVYSKGDDAARLLKGWKPCYNAQFTDRSARKLLTAIEPYLIVKKDVVKEILDSTSREI